jgi:toluene monooxygenase system protein D
VVVLDRDDYVRIHTAQTCRLTRASLERHLGQPVQLATLEIDMPAFKGRLRTRTDEYVWFYDK